MSNIKNTKSNTALAMLIATVALTATPLTTSVLAYEPDAMAASEHATKAPTMDAKAKKVWDKYIKATMGDQMNEQNIESIRMVGTMSVPAQGMVIKMNVLIAPGTGMRVKLELPGMGVFDQGVAGDVVWSNNMMEGPKILDGEMAEQSMKEMDIYADLHWEKYFQDISYKGEETVTMPDGTEIAAVALDLTDITTGEVSTRYIDSATGLAVKSVTMASIPGGGQAPSTTYTTDYKSVGGIQFPFKTTAMTGPIQQVIEFTSIEINVEIGDDELTLPEEIQELIED